MVCRINQSGNFLLLAVVLDSALERDLDTWCSLVVDLQFGPAFTNALGSGTFFLDQVTTYDALAFRREFRKGL